MKIPFRIGHGFDVHAFGPGDSIILGGVRIPYSKGIIAHSDGDVVYHSVCDALLGAAALGDIGHYFPDTDKIYQGISSRLLLQEVMKIIQAQSYVVGNVDVTIIAQQPKMAPHIPQMRSCLAQDLKIQISQVNLKATTTEKLGYIGRQEGIAVHAVALLMQD